ncbi:hypothetical protein J6590_022932 [Homalodisca vitripennis]|nr:hypothetical protein J6590_022932 [Homalodisca vitripennis]
MSCSDSDPGNKEKTIDGSDMGDVIGKETDEAETEEMSSEFLEIVSEREDADGAASSDEQRAPNSDIQIFSCELLTLRVVKDAAASIKSRSRVAKTL